MGGYLVNFAIYTMAMIGLIFFALMIYKRFSCDGIIGKKSGFLGVEDTINIAPRKNLYVIRAGNERFLIAGDVDKTTLISKLDDNFGQNSQSISQNKTNTREFRELNVEKLRQRGIDELPDITGNIPRAEGQNVLHSMVRKINQ